MRPTSRHILATFAEMEEVEARRFVPTVVLVDAKNRIVKVLKK